MIGGRWAACAVLALAGCPKRVTAPPPPQIVEVRVVDRTPPEEKVPGIDLAALNAKAAEVAAATSGLRLTDGGAACDDPRARCFRLRVELHCENTEEKSTGKGVMRALVHAQLSPLGELGARGYEDDAVGEREYEIAKRGDAAAAWRAHTLRAVEDVVRGVGARARLGSGDAGAIVAAIDGRDEELREEAIRIAGERREKQAVPSLLKLLKSDDHAVRDAAIGALGSIGDGRAVRPLTEVARFRDLSDLPKVLDALAAIGGDEARAYLEFVATGHDNDEIRGLAKEALEHLDRRRARDLSATTR